MEYLGKKTVIPLKANILSLFPIHRRYFELFGGTGEILKSKTPVEFTAIVEINDSLVLGDSNVYSAGVVVSLNNWFRNWQSIMATEPGPVAVHGCAISFADWLTTAGRADDLVYADPPYKISTRSSKYSKYKHELTDAQHEEFIDKLICLPCRVVVSHYVCSTYDNLLLNSGWSRIVIPTSYRGTVREEGLYFNFPFNSQRQEPSRAGVDKTDRQRIKRKASRWLNKFKELPAYEQQAILKQIQEK